MDVSNLIIWMVSRFSKSNVDEGDVRKILRAYLFLNQNFYLKTRFLGKMWGSASSVGPVRRSGPLSWCPAVPVGLEAPAFSEGLSEAPPLPCRLLAFERQSLSASASVDLSFLSIGVEEGSE